MDEAWKRITARLLKSFNDLFTVTCRCSAIGQEENFERFIYLKYG